MESDKKKPIIIKAQIDETDDEGRGSATGSGGQSGAIKFRDFTGMSEPKRDDLLPADEKKRLLAVHNSSHESRVKKQKETRDQRQQVKEGKVSLQQYREGLAAKHESQYKSHPILSNKAQFSGMDSQLNPDPIENRSEANEELRNELELQYRLRYAPSAPAKKFDPRPQFNR